MEIRRAVEADLETIGLMWQQLVAYHRELSPDLPHASPQGATLYARRLRDKLYDPYSRILVAEVDGQVIGYIFGVIVDLVPEVFQSETGGFLADIFVDASHRSQGVGRALVTALSTWYSQQGIHYFEWYVAAANAEGRAFWDAVGGRQVMLRMRVDIGTGKERQIRIHPPIEPEI